MLVITNRLLCDGDFLERIETVAAKKPKGIVLREKIWEPGNIENWL